MSARAVATALTTACLCCLIVQASASTHVVDQGGSGDFLTIQDAVNAAADEDTILILAGDYVETVVCVGKHLTYIGEGVGQTNVRGMHQDLPTVEIHGTRQGPDVGRFFAMSVRSHPSGQWAVRWDEGRGIFDGCEVIGRVGGGDAHGSVSVTDCSVTAIAVTGGYVTSTVNHSNVGWVGLHGHYVYDPWSGGSWYEDNYLETSGSVFGIVTLGCSAHLQSEGDAFGDVVSGCQGTCRATGSSFGSISLDRGGLILQDCTVGGAIIVDGSQVFGGEAMWELAVTRCLVGGDLVLDYFSTQEFGLFSVQLTHNTILGDLTTAFELSSGITVRPYRVRSNIVQGQTVLDGNGSWVWSTVTHNDFVGGLTADVPPDSVYANISAPPLFCSASAGDFELQDCSPCVGAAHDGGDIGAFGVGCQCVTPIQDVSWGRIKAMFRQPSN